MARSLESKQNVNAPSAQFPFGRIRDDSGANDGTPVNEEVYGDFHQFFAKLLSEGGITPNALPESETDGFQYFEALYNLSIRENIRRFGVFNQPLVDITLSNAPQVNDFDFYIDQIYVADGANNQISIYSLDGTFERAISNAAVTNYRGVHVDREDGRVYVSDNQGDFGRGGYFVFDNDGTYQPTLSVPDFPESMNNERIMVDGDTVYIPGGQGGTGKLILYDKTTGNQIGSTLNFGQFNLSITPIRPGLFAVYSNDENLHIFDYNFSPPVSYPVIALDTGARRCVADAGFIYVLGTGAINPITLEGVTQREKAVPESLAVAAIQSVNIYDNIIYQSDASATLKRIKRNIIPPQ